MKVIVLTDVSTNRKRFVNTALLAGFSPLADGTTAVTLAAEGSWFVCRETPMDIIEQLAETETVEVPFPGVSGAAVNAARAVQRTALAVVGGRG